MLHLQYKYECVYYETHTKHMNLPCGENAVFLMLKQIEYLVATAFKRFIQFSNV
jgi:hypothetical protein